MLGSVRCRRACMLDSSPAAAPLPSPLVTAPCHVTLIGAMQVVGEGGAPIPPYGGQNAPGALFPTAAQATRFQARPVLLASDQLRPAMHGALGPRRMRGFRAGMQISTRYARPSVACVFLFPNIVREAHGSTVMDGDARCPSGAPGGGVRGRSCRTRGCRFQPICRRSVPLSSISSPLPTAGATNSIPLAYVSSIPLYNVRNGTGKWYPW